MSVLAALTALTTETASADEMAVPLPPRVTRAKVTLPSALMGDVAMAAASNAGANSAAISSGIAAEPPPVSGQSRPREAP